MSRRLVRKRAGRRNRRQTNGSSFGNSEGVATTPQSGQTIMRYNGSYMPPKFVNKMICASTWTCSTAGGFGYYTYRMNDVYDPYVGAGGDGCHGIDEMQAIYGRYIVRRSWITITAVAQGDDVTTLHVHPSANSDVPTMSAAEGCPEVKAIMLVKYKPMTVTLNARISKWLQGANDRDAGAASDADPALQSYWKILLQNGTANALNVMIRVQIVYETEWSTLKASNDVDA